MLIVDATLQMIFDMHFSFQEVIPDQEGFCDKSDLF